MTLPIGAVGAPILASHLAQVYNYINNSANRAIFKSNGTFIVPPGVHQFRVYLAGLGGNGSGFNIVGDTEYDGFAGGSSPLISAVITGQAIGATFAVIIGNGTNDGTSKFGALMQCTKGTEANSGGMGALGTPTFPIGQPTMYHDNSMFSEPYVDFELSQTYLRGYGVGGRGAYHGPNGAVGALAGMPGICVVEW